MTAMGWKADGRLSRVGPTDADTRRFLRLPNGGEITLVSNLLSDVLWALQQGERKLRNQIILPCLVSVNPDPMN